MTTTVHLSDAPAIAGLSFRPIRGEQDADALLAVRTGCLARDAIDLLSTLEGAPSRDQMIVMLSGAVAGGQQDQWLVAQVTPPPSPPLTSPPQAGGIEGGAGRAACPAPAGVEGAVGYSRIVSWREADGMWVYLTLGWVLPEWRGQGIGTAMLHWTEDRIRRLAATEHPNEKAEFAANASSTEKDATALLLHEGYYVGYTALEMGLDASTPIPAPTALPAGIELRPALPEHYALIAASIQESYQNEFAAGRYAEDFDPATFAAELSDPKYDPTLWQIAWDGDQVAGQAMTVLGNGRAEVFEVSVRPAWRRRGLARALLLRALHRLRARGVDAIRLHTNNEFPTRAQDLYRSAGFRLLKEFPRYRKPFDSQHTS